jgi:hypothetical protein
VLGWLAILIMPMMSSIIIDIDKYHKDLRGLTGTGFTYTIRKKATGMRINVDNRPGKFLNLEVCNVWGSF